MFDLREQGTSVRTELLAGLTTYLTMAYIVVVNPSILAQAGIDPGAAFTATCIAAAIGSAAMGLLANRWRSASLSRSRSRSASDSASSFTPW
jgi:AGZA family xanthine/uracil permease-like MFS transporter